MENKNKKKKGKKRRRARKMPSYRDRKRARNENRILNYNLQSIQVDSNKNIIENKDKNKITIFKSSTSINNFDGTKKNNNNNLDDLDLNNLEYDKAVDLDKRTLFQIYLSKLKSNHLVIYTFFFLL